MAMDYDQRKKNYESLDDDKKQRYNNALSKGNENGIGNQYMQQYKQEMNNNQQGDNNSSNFNNQNGTNGQNQTQQQPIQQDSTYQDTKQNPKAMTLDEWNNSDLKKQYDAQNKQVSPDLDQSKFQQDPGKITVQEGTAQQTGRPDYQASSEARLNEMKGNLDHYFATSPRMFSDRETFNRVFEYNTRESDAQRQLLDSYWKRKEDMDKASQYTNGESIMNGMNNAEITTDQLNLLKEYNPEAYRKWQQLQEDEIKKRIVNDIVPPTIEAISGKINGMIEALGIQAQEALDIEGIYNDTMTKVGAYQTLEDANRTVKEIEAITNKKTAIMNRYAASTGGTVSDALAAARMQKAIAPYNEQLQGLQYQYQDYSNLYSQKTATATQAANVRALQAAENQRIWNQKCSALGFATSALSYRTPEQTKQLELQYQQAMNEMELLQESRLKDLNRYDAYATAKLNNQLQQELTDLSVEDETQLKANLNNALADYYKNYGDIIQRSQAQAVDDIIAYAKKNGISVAQALTENFIKPLQNKQEYKNKIASDYAAPTSASSVGYSKITINGKDYLVQGGRIIDPSSIGIGGGGETKAKPYNIVAPEIMESGVDAFMSDKKTDGTQKGGQCGKFVNDYLVSIGATDSANRYFGNEDINTRAKRCNSQTATKGSVAVFNYNHLSDDGINHGHVAVVTKTYKDGSFDVVESNYPSGGTIGTRHIEANDAACLGFINPSLGASATQGYNAKDPYSGVSGYTSGGIAINNGGWIDSLESLYGRKWANATEMKDVLSDYGLTQVEYNEQKERYMNYVETQEMVNSILDVKARAEKLKEWAQDDSNNNLKGPMDLSIAEDGLGFWNDLFTTDATIESIQEGKALYDNLMSNAGFQKYLDMRQNGAQFGIMTDSERKKVDSSVAPLRWEQKDTLFLNNLNDMIRGYDQVLEKLGYDFEEGSKPETAEEVEIIPNQGTGDNMILTRTDENGKMWYSYDGGKTWN